MKIAIDIDEVLCKTNDFFLEDFNKEHKTNYTREDIKSYYFDNFEKYEPEYVFKKLIEHFSNKGHIYTLSENAKETLIKLKEKHSLSIITAREDFMKELTLTWLEKHFGKDFFENIYFSAFSKIHKCKSQICEDYAFELLIEDAPAYALNTSKKGIKVFLMDCPWNKNLEENKNLIRVKNWLDIEEKINEL